ncbi:MAG: hypothetical protein E6J34_20975 [Chloroflexi bacterium]|nr:MAG: hypothetical protein E6J34_20975 [Chloroflexota bacterium]
MRQANTTAKLAITSKHLSYTGLLFIALLVSSCSFLGKADSSPTPTATVQSTQNAVSWLQIVNGQLVYGQDAQGNKIPDFSSVGYGGGGVPLPNVATRFTLNPQSTGDDTSRIQQALDQAGKLTPNGQGIRGAVMLTAGTYRISGTLAIKTSGVVLRGAGSGSGGTILLAQGQPHTLVKVGGDGTWQHDGSVHHVTDAYVPVGARTFKVDSTSGLAVGDHIIVQRPTTAAWIHAIGMDRIPPRKNGGIPRQWQPGPGLLFDRIITAVNGQQITIDAPLTNALEHDYTDATVWKYTFPGRISQTGIENLSSDAIAVTSTPNYASDAGYHKSSFVSIEAVENGWVNNVIIHHYGNGMSIGGLAKWVTITHSQSLDVVVPQEKRDAPAAFNISGQQSLIEYCKVTGFPIHAWVTQALTAGPDVFYKCSAEATSRIDGAPHQRWGTGTLFDNMSIANGHLALQNRGNFGSGQGWSAANDVLWNCVTKDYLVENPPTAHNWAFGCQGTSQTSAEPQGVIVSPGQALQPDSLYVQQLRERLHNPSLNP